MNWLSFFKLPSRIAAVLAGVGMLGGVFAPSSAEAGGYRKVPEKYQDVDVRVLQNGPTLLFSDSPEMVYENGILYKDIVEGEGRVFFHHVNGTGNTKKLAVLMRPVNKLTTITWGCRGIGDPDKHKNELKEKRDKRRNSNEKNKELPDYSFYQKVSDLPLTTLAKGEYLEVLSQGRNMQHAGTRLKPEQLLTGMFDFHANHPVEIVIMMCDPEEDVAKFSKDGTVLPMDEHPLRGTYRNADLTYIIKKPIQMKWYQARALCLAGSDDLYFLKGTDRITGMQTVNHGNYGVVYHLIYSVAGEHPIRMGINPWGGEFYGAGLMLSEEKTDIISIPGKKIFFGKGDEVDDVFLHAPNHKRKDAEFIWSPPGASNLPIRVFWTVNKL